MLFFMLTFDQEKFHYGYISVWNRFNYIRAFLYLVSNYLCIQLFWLRLFIVVFSRKRMNAYLWHSNFCYSNIVVIVGVSFASAVCPIQYTVDLTSARQKFVMSVIHYLCETLPHTSALNHHIHQTNFFMWRFITVLQKVVSL